MTQPQYPGLPGYPSAPQGYPGPAVPAAQSPQQQAPAQWPQQAAPPTQAAPQQWQQPPQQQAPAPWQQQPPQAAPAPQPWPQQPPPGYGANGMPGPNMADIGAQIAAATMGVTRYPRLNGALGDYTCKVELSKKPERSTALIIEFTIVESSNPQQPVGMRVSWYQDLSGGSPDKTLAQQGATLAAILRCSGFNTLEEAAAAGCSGPVLTAHINKCFAEPGPLVGRLVRVSVVPSDAKTRDGQPINNINFTAVK